MANPTVQGSDTSKFPGSFGAMPTTITLSTEAATLAGKASFALGEKLLTNISFPLTPLTAAKPAFRINNSALATMAAVCEKKIITPVYATGFTAVGGTVVQDQNGNVRGNIIVSIAASAAIVASAAGRILVATGLPATTITTMRGRATSASLNAVQFTGSTAPFDCTCTIGADGLNLYTGAGTLTNTLALPSLIMIDFFYPIDIISAV